MLSRARSELTHPDHCLQEESDAYVQIIMNNLPASEGGLGEIKKAQQADDVCRKS